jgi:hypothetical protein
MRHPPGWHGGAPHTAMSPPPLTMAAVRPASCRVARARPTAQPLTSPVGSTPPGAAQGSNQPSVAARASAHRPRDLLDLGRHLACRCLAAPQPGDRAVRIPGAEHRVGLSQNAVHPHAGQSFPPKESVTAPRPARTTALAMRTTAQACRWRYSQGMIRRCMPGRGGDAHHPRRPFGAVVPHGEPASR